MSSTIIRNSPSGPEVALDVTTDQIQNLSTLPPVGGVLTAALSGVQTSLTTIVGRLDTLSSTEVLNASGVPGATVTAALDSLLSGSIPVSSLAPIGANTLVGNPTAGTTNPSAISVALNSVVGRVGGNIVSGPLQTAQVAAEAITNPLLAQMASNTVKANATAGSAVPSDLSVPVNAVVGRVGGNLVAAAIVTAQMALNQVTNPVLAQMPALTVKGNATAGSANAQDIAAAVDDTLLRRVSGALSFGQITAAMIPSGIIPLSAIAAITAESVVVNATSGAASPTALAVPLNTVLGRVVGDVVAAQLVGAQVAASTIADTNLAVMGGNTVKANATAAGANPSNLSVTPNTVVGRQSGNLVSAQVIGAQVATNTIDDGNLAQMAATSVKANPTGVVANAQNLAAAADDTVLRRVAGALSFGQLTAAMIPSGIIPVSALAAQAANTVVANATAGSASPTAFAIGTNTVLGRVAGNLVSAQLVGAQVAANTLDNSLLAQMTALSVKANPTAVSATPSDVSAAGVADSVLLRSGVTLTFALIQNANITGGTIAVNKLAAIAATSVIANATSASAVPTALAASADDTVLRRTGGALSFGTLTAAMIPAGTVALASLATQAANTIVANATAGVASPTAVAVGANTVVGRVAGNLVSAQLVNAQMVGGALGTVKGVALSGVAGTLADLTGADVASLGRISGIIDTTTTGTIASYSPASYVSGQTNYVRISPPGAVVLRGMPVAANAMVILRVGRGSLFTVQLNHEDGAAVAGEAFNCPDNKNLVLYAGDAVVMWNAENRVNVMSVGRLHAARQNSGATVFTRGLWNLIDGTGVALGVSDDNVDNELELTFALAPAAANTVKANATAASAVPLDLAVGTNSVVGRVAGNLVAAQAVNAQIAGGALSTVKGVATGGVAGTLADLSGTELVEFLRWGTPQNQVLAATTNDLVLNATTTVLRLSSTTGPQTLTGLTGGVNGRLLLVEDIGASGNDITLASNTGSAAANQFRTPGGVNYPIGFRSNTILEWDSSNNDWRVWDRLVPPAGMAAIAANTVLANATAGSAQPTAVTVGTSSVVGRVSGNLVAAGLVRQQLGAESSGEGVLWTKTVAFTASGAPGTSVDITIFSANAPAARITLGQLRLSVAFAGTAALRTATGGGGSVILPSALAATQTFDTTAVGRRNDNSAATATITAGSTLVLRIDQSCTGEVTLELDNT